MLLLYIVDHGASGCKLYFTDVAAEGGGSL